jgi:molybdenum cofactor synthesis domain-containing protein
MAGKPEPVMSSPARPTAAILIIGDEILSGRTRDSNLHHLAGRLSERGISLVEARIVADRTADIVAAVNALRHAADHVFTSGGIGPTHDDITADAVALAFGVGIDVRADARAILATHYPGGEAALNPARLRMARIPDGATLIDNPVSRAPGFSIGNVHVMAGVPAVFEAMVESLLPQIAGGPPLLSEVVRIERGEGDIAGPLAEIAGAFPEVAIGSYPFQQNGLHGTRIVLRATDADTLAQATDRVRALV